MSAHDILLDLERAFPGMPRDCLAVLLIDFIVADADRLPAAVAAAGELAAALSLSGEELLLALAAPVAGRCAGGRESAWRDHLVAQAAVLAETAAGDPAGPTPPEAPSTVAAGADTLVVDIHIPWQDGDLGPVVGLLGGFGPLPASPVGAVLQEASAAAGGLTAVVRLVNASGGPALVPYLINPAGAVVAAGRPYYRVDGPLAVDHAGTAYRLTLSTKEVPGA